MARKFQNRKFKLDKENHLSFLQDSYTDNEMVVLVENATYYTDTMITKEDLKRFSLDLRKREVRIFSEDSNYASNPFFLAEKTMTGYRFKVKGIVEAIIELPFSKVDKIVSFLDTL